eukprot:3240344-Amphidinium_carterae.1
MAFRISRFFIVEFRCAGCVFINGIARGKRGRKGNCTTGISQAERPPRKSDATNTVVSSAG